MGGGNDNWLSHSSDVRIRYHNGSMKFTHFNCSFLSLYRLVATLTVSLPTAPILTNFPSGHGAIVVSTVFSGEVPCQC